MTGEERRVGRLFVGLGGAFGFTMSCFGAAATVAWVTEAGLSPTQLIAMGAVMELTVLLTEVPTGVVADRHSRKWATVIGYLLFAVGIAGSLSTSFVVLVAAQVVWGVGFTFQSGAPTAWATDQLGRNIDDLLVRQARVRTIGVASGAVAAGLLGWVFDLRVALVVATCSALVTGLAVAVLMVERVRPDPATRAESPWRTAADGWRATTRHRSVRIVMAAVFLAGFGSEVIDRLFVFRLVDLGVPRVEPVVAVAALGLVGHGVTWLALGRLRTGDDGSGHGPRALGAGLAVTAVGGLALAVAASFWIGAAGFVLYVTARQTVRPIEIAVVNRHAPSNERATVLSFHGQADAFGQVLGGPTMVLVAALTTAPIAIAIGAAVFAAAGLVAAAPAGSE